jgi:hypothetical protein
MNWFTKLFGPKPLSQSDRNFFDAHDSFATGKKLFQEAVYVKRGFRSQTTFYEMCLPTDAEIVTKKKYPEKFIEEELRKIKRHER